jgi:hypothetical protein
MHGTRQNTNLSIWLGVHLTYASNEMKAIAMKSLSITCWASESACMDFVSARSNEVVYTREEESLYRSREWFNIRTETESLFYHLSKRWSCFSSRLMRNTMLMQNCKFYQSQYEIPDSVYWKDKLVTSVPERMTSFLLSVFLLSLYTHRAQRFTERFYIHFSAKWYIEDDHKRWGEILI